jgi:phosphatidate cytidylyltransferase
MIRLLTALVLAPLVWLLLRYAPPWAFHLGVGLALSAGILESHGIFRSRGARPFTAPGLLIGWGVGASFIDLPWIDVPLSMPLALGTIVVLVSAMVFRDDPSEMLDSVTATLFPVLFVALTLGHVMALREFGGGEVGRELVFLLFLCVMLADSAAYYVGSSIGKRRIAPKLSPKKSLEGALAGVVASVLAALAVRAWFWQELPLHHALTLGVLLAVAGIFGDLAESLFKRAGGVKDASALLPGHGGVLDRADGLLFAAPVLYYYYRTFLGYVA